jgi:hypothetical protein
MDGCTRKKELNDVKSPDNLLARLVIAKVEDEKLLQDIFCNTPVIQGNPEWRCRTWIADALCRLANAPGKAVGTAELDWDKIEGEARRYVMQKTDEGRYLDSESVLLPRPTWDMLEGREVIP